MVTRKSSAKRKLIAVTLLNELTRLQEEGVPVANLLRRFELDISQPTLTKLIQYNKDNDNAVVYDSLYPEWLDPAYTNTQETPDDYYYVGRFPRGEWRKS